MLPRYLTWALVAASVLTVAFVLACEWDPRGSVMVVVLVLAAIGAWAVVRRDARRHW